MATFTTDWLLPTRVAQDSAIGDTPWVELDDLLNDDGVYATFAQVNLIGSNESALMKGYLVFNDVIDTTTNAVASNDRHPYANVGGASNVWGHSGITGLEAKDEKFGVAFGIGRYTISGGTYANKNYYVLLTGFNPTIPDNAIITGIEATFDTQDVPTGGGTDTVQYDCIKVRFTFSWDIEVLGNATSFGGIYVNPPNREKPYKKFRFKAYSEDGDYLGDWKDASEPKYKQDINNLIGSMPISFARNDLALEPSVDFLLNENDAQLTDEDDSPFLIDVAPTTGLGEGTSLDTNNDVVVDAIYGQFEALLNEDDSPILNEDGDTILVEDGYPLGRTIFRGYVPRWELPIDGDGISSEIRSYSQDLANILLETDDTAYIDVSARSSSSIGIDGGGPTDNNVIFQTFTMAAEKTVNKVRIYPYAGWYYDVVFTVRVYTGTPSAYGTLLGFGTGTVNRNNPVDSGYDVVFNSPITLPAGSYFFEFTTVEAKTGGNVTYPFNLFLASSAYSGGAMSYLWGGHSPTLTSTSNDVAFILYEAGGETTRVFNSYDPSNMLKEVVDFARSRGARINYTSTSIELTNTSVSYTFRNQTIKQVIEKILELCPANWFFFYDFGTDTIYLRERSDTPDRYLRKGRSVAKGGKIIKTIEQVVNDVPFSGGGDPALYIRDRRAPASGTRRGLKTLSDNRVLSEDTAYILTGSEIDGLNQALYAGDVTITEDGTFYLEDVEVGEMLGFSGFGELIDSIVVQSVSKEYNADKMPVALTYNLPKVNKRVEDIKRNLDTLETTNNPVEPS